MTNTKGRGEVVRTHRAVTILNRYPYRHVQVILRYVTPQPRERERESHTRNERAFLTDTIVAAMLGRLFLSPAEVVLGFDIDCCAVGFDGQRVYAMDRWIRAINKGYNLVNQSRRSLTYEVRLFKYSKRGFAVAVPQLDKKRVDPLLFEKHLPHVQGLAKLLLYEHAILHPTSPYAAYRFREASQEALGSTQGNADTRDAAPPTGTANRLDLIEALNADHPSDYSDLNLPWGPEWYTNQIVRLLRQKDRMLQATMARQQQAKRQWRGRGRGKYRGGNTRDRGTSSSSSSSRSWRAPGTASVAEIESHAARGYHGESSARQHKHHFVSGIDGVISGTAWWCKICKQHRPPRPLTPSFTFDRPGEQAPEADEADKGVHGPLYWISDSPAYQVRAR